jgi:hypothetical protein
LARAALTIIDFFAIKLLLIARRPRLLTQHTDS